jgi:hypothetical protein
LSLINCESPEWIVVRLTIFFGKIQAVTGVKEDSGYFLCGHLFIIRGARGHVYFIFFILLFFYGSFKFLCNVLDVIKVLFFFPFDITQVYVLLYGSYVYTLYFNMSFILSLDCSRILVIDDGPFVL